MFRPAHRSRGRGPRLALAAVLVTLPLLPAAVLADRIHDAAEGGDLAAVRDLLAADPGLLMQPGDRQAVPLHFAASGGHPEVIDLLLQRGTDLAARDADGDTPLHWAAYRGRVQAIALLLERGAEIDARNHELFTPLLYAVRTDQLDAAAALIDAGADLEAAMDYGRTPLLWVARETGSLAMARLLLARGADVNAQDRSGWSSLELAAWRGFRTLVGILLDHDARADLTEHMPGRLLGFAVERGLERLYAVAIEAGAEVDVTDDGRGGLLHVAARGGAAGIVGDLLERGAAVDARDSYGWTPLHYAARFERAGVTEALLARGASAGTRSMSGWTPRGLAAERGATAVVDLLRAHGAGDAPRDFPALSGPLLGQGDPPPGLRLFAPDVVATCLGEHSCPAFTPDGREAYWSAHTEVPDSGYVYGTIVTSREVDGRWTPPRRASFANERGDDSPCVATDGRRLFFVSARAMPADWPGRRDGEHIWVVDRAGDGWGEPRPLPPVVNDLPHHWQISVAAGGNLYFASRRGEVGGEDGIFVSRLVDGEYAEPEFLGFADATPFVAPDEGYLITMHWGQRGPENLIRFRSDGGGWSEPVNIFAQHDGLGGLCPVVSPDGRAFFLLANLEGENNIHWMDAGFLGRLRPAGRGRPGG